MSETKGFLQRFKDTFRSSSSSNTSTVTERATLPDEDEFNEQAIETKRRVSRSRSGRIKQYTRSRSLICEFTFQPMGDEDFKRNPQDASAEGGGAGNNDKKIEDKEIQKRIEKTWALSTENISTKDLQF